MSEYNKRPLPNTVNAQQPLDLQPNSEVWDFENEWDQGLCSFCSNCGACCCAFFCCPCFTCKLFERAGECLCTPMFAPGSLCALRAKLRTGFRISGSVCKDCISTTFCTLCVLLQMSHELQYQGL